MTKYKTNQISKWIEEINSFQNKHPIYWRVRRFIYNLPDIPRDICRAIKRGLQRGYRGWADEDVWNFDYYLTKIIIEGLEQIKLIQHGHPGDLTEGAWMDTLNKIIITFKLNQQILDGNLWLVRNKNEKKRIEKKLKIKCLTDKQIKDYDEGWMLFTEYFNSLWD